MPPPTLNSEEPLYLGAGPLACALPGAGATFQNAHATALHTCDQTNFACNSPAARINPTPKTADYQRSDYII